MHHSSCLVPALVLALAPLHAADIPPEQARRDVFGARELVLRRVDDPVEGLRLQLDFDGLVDWNYDIWSSPNLEDWFKVGLVTATGGEGFYGTAFPADSSRFYRAEPFQSGDAVPPSWPVAAFLAADAIGADFVDLDWSAASDDTGIVAYALYLDGRHVATVAAGRLSGTLRGLAANTVHEIDLVACDAGGNCTQLPTTLTLRTRVEQEPLLNATRNASVFLSSGEFSLTRTDLAIRGRELDLVFARTYRSDFEKAGPLGYGWNANVYERLRERDNGDIVWLQGIGRTDLFTLKEEDGEYEAPTGVFMTLMQDVDGHRLVGPDGTTRRFGPGGRLLTLTTRNGNAITYGYSGGRLTSLTDDLGRVTVLDYDADGRLDSITDFSGRVVDYRYDASGNLAAVRSPLVTDTPNGNDFPSGKTERYQYDTGNPDPDLAHNLVAVIAPQEVADGSLAPRHTVTYGSAGVLHDRVVEETHGGTNASGLPAGGTTTYAYATAADGRISETTLTDPRGNEVRHVFGTTGHLLSRIEVLAGRPDAVTAYTYDPEGNVRVVTHPEGDTVTRVYDSSHPSRRSQGNLLSETRAPGPRGADQPALVTSYSYEPVFNQLRRIVDPRGNIWTHHFDYEENCDFAAISAKVGLAAGKAETLLLAAGMCAGPPAGELNHDGDATQVSGNVILIEHPTVELDPASNQATLTGNASQVVTEWFHYNAFGQLVLHRDAERNVHLMTYHPASDPNGDGTPDNPSGDPATGGYRSGTVRDAQPGSGRNSGTNPAPTAIATHIVYNPRGVPVSRVDARGVETRTVLNALDQPVQVLRAATTGNRVPVPAEPLPLPALNYLTEYRYDANNNLVAKEVEDRGDSSGTGGVITTGFDYDILDRLLTVTEEIDAGTTRTTEFRYDANGNRVLRVEPEGNAVAHRYEERNLLVATTSGALAPPPGAQVAGGQVFNPRGGAPSTVRFLYDGNRNRVAATDAADTDGSAANNGIAGGELTTFAYDGYDRLVETVDPAGNVTTRAYDPNDNLVRTTRFGPDGGATPGERTPSSNRLAETRHRYDALNRRVRSDAELFSNTVPQADLEEGATGIGKGDLLPGDGAVNTQYEYDALGRLTFEVEDDGDVTGFRYDGAGRRIVRTDPTGNSAESAYDDLGNLIETRETDVSTLTGVADQVFLTTRGYDALNRLTLEVDNLGHASRFVYDSRDNLVATSDANGPPGGASINRRVFPDGPRTVNAINSHGNVILHTYDGLDRRVQTTHILTASGTGDGTLTPSPDPTQGAGDGLITTTVHYDRNSLVVARDDDLAFRTRYEYDNLNRLVTEIRGDCTGSPPGGYRCDPPTRVEFVYDADHNVVSRTDEVGSVVAHTYDALNRPVRADVTRGPGVAGTTRQDFEYDGLGRVTRTWDDNGDATHDGVETIHHYDSLSRPVRETTVARPGTPAGSTDFAWRADNLRSGIRYPDGSELEAFFDPLDRVVNLREAGAPVAIAEFDYIGTGRLLEVRHPQNGTSGSYLNGTRTEAVGYDGIRRPVFLRDLGPGAVNLTAFAHGWDRTGNRRGAQKQHDPLNSETYSYDSAYRLTSMARPAEGATPPGQSSWELDGNHNWVSVDGSARTHSSFNEIATRIIGPVGASVEHDRNGNLTVPGGGLTYRWDAFNRLVSVLDAGTPIARYHYDAAGRRVRRENLNLGPALDGETFFLHDGHQVVEERDGTGAVLRQFVYGPGTDLPLRFDDVTGGSSYYYHRNTLGSTAALTDGSGNVVERVRYDAYGTPSVTQLDGAAATGNPFLFTARRLDADTGLYYHRARYLDPELGRFLSRDPSGIWGDAANRGNPYAYCNNNPINCTDPTGRVTWTSAFSADTIAHEMGHNFMASGGEPARLGAAAGKVRNDIFVPGRTYSYTLDDTQGNEALLAATGSGVGRPTFGDPIGNYNFRSGAVRQPAGVDADPPAVPPGVPTPFPNIGSTKDRTRLRAQLDLEFTTCGCTHLFMDNSRPGFWDRDEELWDPAGSRFSNGFAPLQPAEFAKAARSVKYGQCWVFSAFFVPTNEAQGLLGDGSVRSIFGEQDRFRSEAASEWVRPCPSHFSNSVQGASADSLLTTDVCHF